MFEGPVRTVTILEQSILSVYSTGDHLSGRCSTKETEFITERDAQILIDNYPGDCQRSTKGLSLSQYCGIIRLDSCILEILPKVGFDKSPDPHDADMARRALVMMLWNARRMEITRLQSVDQGRTQAPLLDIFIEAFLQSALKVARRGLLTRYEGHSDPLPVVKGRIDVQTQVTRNFAAPHLLHCQYEDFTVDNPYNRVVLTTIVLCRKWIRRSETLRLWSEAHSRFASVSLISGMNKIDRLPMNRMTQYYRPVLIWCEWILKSLSPSVASGRFESPGLFFDMNKLFEEHVRMLETQCLGNEYRLISQGPTIALATTGLSDVFFLHPDITIWCIGEQGTTTSIKRIVDAKWKFVDPGKHDWGVAESDIYQMLAYAMRYGCDSVDLVYPRPCGMSPSAKPPVFRIVVPNHRDSKISVRVRLAPLT